GHRNIGKEPAVSIKHKVQNIRDVEDHVQRQNRVKYRSDPFSIKVDFVSLVNRNAAKRDGDSEKKEKRRPMDQG
uniref:Uncharacterized protein n=1 Tax=Ciona savignyi TaxID=51511 RepID=H2YIM5_CIOSA